MSIPEHSGSVLSLYPRSPTEQNGGSQGSAWACRRPGCPGRSNRSRSRCSSGSHRTCTPDSPSAAAAERIRRHRRTCRRIPRSRRATEATAADDAASPGRHPLQRSSPAAARLLAAAVQYGQRDGRIRRASVAAASSSPQASGHTHEHEQPELWSSDSDFWRTWPEPPRKLTFPASTPPPTGFAARRPGLTVAPGTEVWKPSRLQMSCATLTRAGSC